MALAQTGHPVNTGRLGLQKPYYCWSSKEKHRQQQHGTYCLSLIKMNTEKCSVHLAFVMTSEMKDGQYLLLDAIIYLLLNTIY